MFVLSDRCFDVSDNLSEIKTIRVFGESLLHVELQTEYGKKEFVCGKDAILNHFMLKSPFGSDVQIERNSFYCSYRIEGETLLISLEDKDNLKNQLWTIDPVKEKLVIALESGSSIIEMSLEEIAKSNSKIID